MLALISGQLGRYAVPKGTKHVLYDLPEDQGREIESQLLSYAFADCNDLQRIQVQTQGEASIIASRSFNSTLAIRLMLILMDPEETPEDRKEVADDLCSLVSDSVIRTAVENNFFSHPLLDEFALEEAKVASAGTVVEEILEHISQHQPQIAAVRAAFDDVPLPLFESKAGLLRAREAAIADGCFRGLAEARFSGKTAEFAILATLTSLRNFPNHRAIVSAWTDKFRSSSRPLQVQKEHREYDEGRATYIAAAGRKAFENAMDQQSAIIEKLREGDIASARRYAEELVESQARVSSPEKVGQSLCRISKEAQRLNILDLQFEWAEKATIISPEDPVTFGHLVDALISLHRFVEAYDIVKRLETSAPSYAQTGLARILRAQGKLVEAEEAYRISVERFSELDDAFHPLAGLGGTLRELGRLDESLDVYNQGLRQFENEAILLTGRAATLTDMGRLEEARQSYSLASQSPTDRLVALNGKATVYKLSGDFARAEREYLRIQAQYSYDSVSRCGLADLRRLEGRHDEALALYKDVIANFHFTAVPYLGMSEVLRELGAPDEAVQVLMDGAARLPDDTRLSIACAAAQRRSGDAQSSLETLNALVARYPKNLIAQLERANTLKSLGHDDLAISAYDVVLELMPHNYQAAIAKSSLLTLASKWDEASLCLDHVPLHTQEWWRAENMRALISLRKGDVRDARQRIRRALQTVPFYKERRTMKASLAAVLVAERLPGDAITLLTPASVQDDDVTKIVRLHALAFARRTAPAREMFLQTEGVTGNLSVIRTEIGRNFGLLETRPAHDAKWIESNIQMVIVREAA